MSPACTQLGWAPSLPPSWRTTQLSFSPLTPPRRSQICPQHQLMSQHQESFLWCIVGEGSSKLSQQRVLLPLPALCRVIQTQSDGGESRKSGLWWGKPREAV